MPRWIDPPLRVYHGTDTTALPSPASSPLVGTPVPFAVNISRCRPFTDFGQGFYVTTNLHQARQWANAKVVRTLSPRTSPRALVLEFLTDRDWLASLEALCFVRPIQDFWNLVHDCRNMFPPHQRVSSNQSYRKSSGASCYEVVYGPVTLWPSLLTIQDCDQISFHNPHNLTGLCIDPISGLPSQPTIADIAPVDVFPT
jgi:hypothetical protein